MMWIETMMHMSGTRANGEKYPAGWTPFEVEDWEGEHLVRCGIARQVAPPEGSAPAPALVPPPAPEPALPVPQSEPSPTAAGPAAEAVPTVRPPAPSDPKQAWVDYAVIQGMDADAAARMTKADLQSRFGPRLLRQPMTKRQPRSACSTGVRLTMRKGASHGESRQDPD